MSDSEESEMAVEEEEKQQGSSGSSYISYTDSEEEKKPDLQDEKKTEEEQEEKSLVQDEVQAPEEPGTLVQIQPVKKVRIMAKSTTTLQSQPQPRRKRFVPKYEVPGVYKIVLSEETQLAIEMVVGSHVNAEYPWKFVDTVKVIESLKKMGDNSEFVVMEKEIEEYKDEKMLMGYIPDESKDFDEFYICVTEEARDHCKQQSDKFIRRQEKKLEKALQRVPRPWTSLGSEKDIVQLHPVDTRPLMEVEIRAAFPTKYDPQKYDIRDTLGVRDGYIELTPYRQKFNNVYRSRVDCGSQIAPAKFDKYAQTVLRYPQNMWTQSIADALGEYDPLAGGDLDEFFEDTDDDDSSSDEEVQKRRARRKQLQMRDEEGLASYKRAFARLRRPSYCKKIDEFMRNAITEMESHVILNSVMDIYSNDYPKLVSVKKIDKYNTMTFEEYLCFTDVRAKDKYVSCAIFHPMWSGIVAICYSDGSPNVMKFVSTRPDPLKRAVYGLNPVMIWSHIDSLYPKLYLECSREVKVLSFCPFDENILVGGCVNGQIVIWDLTNKLKNVETVEILNERREKYRIAMKAHMDWFKNIEDAAVVQTTAMSSLLTGHYGAITAITWLSPNFHITPTGKQFPVKDDKKSLMLYTGSEDGTILIWNISYENVTFVEGKKIKKSKRVLQRPPGLESEESPFKVLDRNLMPYFKVVLGVAGRPQTLPIQSMIMQPLKIHYVYTPSNKGTGRMYFKCEIEPQVEADMKNIAFCGSQHGEVRQVKWEGHAFNTGEIVNSEYADIQFSCKIHDGIVSCAELNPFINHLKLTVGGKIFAIWSDKYKGRPLIWKKRPFRLTDGRWSLYKPSLFFITTAEGDLETWDLLVRSDKPIAVQTISGSFLTGVSVHTLPVTKNLIGVSDSYGSFRMFIAPPIFMIGNAEKNYVARMEFFLDRDLNVMNSFNSWQEDWKDANSDILQEMLRKEGILLEEKEKEKARQKEEEEIRLQEEAEARRLAKIRIIGPEERWQKIIQKLIERTIAVKKRINKAELLENEKPLRELEAQRLEKERRMLEIMKNQKTIFNDTVAILFPEAIKKPPKSEKAYLGENKEIYKREFLEQFRELKVKMKKTVKENPYRAVFNWESTISDGKERRTALNAHEYLVRMHRERVEDGDIYRGDYNPRISEEFEDEIIDEGAVFEEETEYGYAGGEP